MSKTNVRRAWPPLTTDISPLVLLVVTLKRSGAQPPTQRLLHLTTDRSLPVQAKRQAQRFDWFGEAASRPLDGAAALGPSTFDTSPGRVFSLVACSQIFFVVRPGDT